MHVQVEGKDKVKKFIDQVTTVVETSAKITR